MHTFEFSESFIDRFSNYLRSDHYRAAGYKKSDYWEFHAGEAQIRINGNQITAEGGSGYYLPPQITERGRIRSVVSRLRPEWTRRKKKTNTGSELLDYFDAFDSVMAEAPVADITRSQFRVDFAGLRSLPGVISSSGEMRERFFAREKYGLNAHTVKAFYFSNILGGYLDPRPGRRILEIGAGSGNLAAILFSSMDRPSYVIVDLPEILCFSILLISDLFPEAILQLPHEMGDTDVEPDFTFLTPAQMGAIPEDSVDLFINTESFQEMTIAQIQAYFDLANNVCKEGAYFFTSNRVEKIPNAGSNAKDTEGNIPVNRFSEYPWRRENQILVYEICRLRRLTQLDDIFIRLEQFQNEQFDAGDQI